MGRHLRWYSMVFDGMVYDGIRVDVDFLKFFTEMGVGEIIRKADGLFQRSEIKAVADPGGFHWFPRKPPLKNDCVTIKCFNYRGVRLDRDTVIRAVTVATKVVCRKFLIYFMYYY